MDGVPLEAPLKEKRKKLPSGLRSLGNWIGGGGGKAREWARERRGVDCRRTRESCPLNLGRLAA